MIDKNSLADLTIKAVENKAIGAGIGGTTSAMAWLNINTAATVAGLCLTAVCIYAQIRIIREAEKKAKREAFEFKKKHPNAPKDLI